MDIMEQIKKIPQKPGVYFFYDKNKKVIYIGKAANLKARVNSHFQVPFLDPRAENRAENTVKIKYIACSSEIEALFLESEFIKRYKPRYNVEWKDEKNFLYIKVKKSAIPEIKLVRRPLKESNVLYFGPYTDSKSLRRSLKVIARILPIKYSFRGALRTSFLWHDKIIQEISAKLGILKKIKYFFMGKVNIIIKDFEKEMKKAVLEKQFEKAALFRDRIKALHHIKETAIFRREEFLKIHSDIALLEIKKELRLQNIPYRIEAFDISNIFGREAVGSLVNFKNGIPSKDKYRRFKIRTVKGIDDYKMLEEVLKRRFTPQEVSHRPKRPSPFAKSGFLTGPDLILIDGGRGQLSTALKVIEKLRLDIDVMALAKKREEIFIFDKDSAKFKMIRLKEDSPALLLIERIRDEAHRFAIIYHRLLRNKKGRLSELDNIVGVGEKTKEKLMKEFKSIGNIKKAPTDVLERIISKKLALRIKEELLRR